MLKLLQYLFVGHAHKWTVIDQVSLRRSNDFGSATGERYTLQCQGCGNLKQKDII